MAWQQNPYKTGMTAGTEVHRGTEVITALESDCTSPSTRITAGDPLTIGDGTAGVGMITTTATTDLVSVDLNGIWYLSVNANNGAVAVGEQLYCHTSTAAVTNTSTTAIPLGIALGAVTSAATTVIAVKLLHAAL